MGGAASSAARQPLLKPQPSESSTEPSRSGKRHTVHGAPPGAPPGSPPQHKRRASITFTMQSVVEVGKLGAKKNQRKKRHSEPTAVGERSNSLTQSERDRQASAEELADVICRATESAMEAAEKAMEAWEAAKKQKTKLHEDNMARRRLVRGVPMFAMMPNAMIDELEKALVKRTFEEGETIFEQGASVDPEGEEMGCFIIEEGVCVEKSQQGNGNTTVIAEHREGELVGERELREQLPREATVTALSTLKLLGIPSRAYTDVTLEVEHREDLLRGTKFFEAFSGDDIRKLACVMERKCFTDSQMIVVQGTPGLHFFILDSGNAIATVRKIVDGKVTRQDVTRYQQGELFGEKAILENQARTASIRAVGGVSVYALRRDDCERIIGPLSQLQAKQYTDEPTKRFQAFLLGRNYRSGRSSRRSR